MSTWCRQVYERVLDPHRLEHLCDLYSNAGGDLITKRQIVHQDLAFFSNIVTFTVVKLPFLYLPCKVYQYQFLLFSQS